MEKLEGWTNDLKTRIAKKAEAAEVTRVYNVFNTCAGDYESQ